MSEQDKENLVVKEIDKSCGIVKKLTVYYDDISACSTSHVTQNSASTGAIKKRKISENPADTERGNNFVPKKRAGIREYDTFVKSRFKIYTDEHTSNDDEESVMYGGKIEKNLENIATNKCDALERYRISDKRLARIKLPELEEKFSARVTPVEIPPVPRTIKKVKALYKDRSSTKIETSETTNALVFHDLEYELPYDDCFIERELEKEVTASKLSRNFRRRNITIEQRNIIVKFLTRLNCHLFLPSFLLYQTVKLFDAVLDAKAVEVKDFQLIALSAMWIAHKREQLVYNIPTAKKMISFAKDLYGGNVELLFKCEFDILKTLNFNIAFADPFSIMCYDITKCNRSRLLTSKEIRRAYSCGSYMIDISLFDEDLMMISVVLLAAVAAETALGFSIENVDDTTEPSWCIWRAPHTAKSYSDEEISAVRTILIRKMYESQKGHNDLEIVFKKYVRSRYGRISHFLGKKVKSYFYEE